MKPVAPQARKPIVLALSRSGEPVAHKIAAVLGAQVHGREGRVDRADAFFANALDHARDLFAAPPHGSKYPRHKPRQSAHLLQTNHVHGPARCSSDLAVPRQQR